MDIVTLEEKIAAGYRLGYDEAVELMHSTPAESYMNWHIDCVSVIKARSSRPVRS